MGAVQDLLDRIRNRNSEAPPQRVPAVEANLYGYTETSFSNRLKAAYEEGERSRLELGRDAAAARSGDEVAAARFERTHAADVEAAQRLWKSVVNWEAVPSPAQLRDVIEATEIYGRWQDNEPRIDESMRHIESKIERVNRPVVEYEGDPVRKPPIKLVGPRDAAGRRFAEEPTWSGARVVDHEIYSALTRLPLDSQTSFMLETENQGRDPLPFQTPDTVVIGDLGIGRAAPLSADEMNRSRAQVMAGAQLSSVKGLFSEEDEQGIRDGINEGRSEGIRRAYGPANPLITPRSRVEFEARELIADTIDAGNERRLLGSGPELETRREAISGRVRSLGLDEATVLADATGRADGGTEIRALYTRALELDEEAAVLVGRTQDANGDADQVGNNWDGRYGDEEATARSAEMRASAELLWETSQAKNREAEALRAEAAEMQKAGEITGRARSGHWDAEIHGPVAEAEAPSKTSIVERAEHVTSEIRQHSETRDLQQNEAPAQVQDPSKVITA
ncbi:protein of unknown function (plasmid) [Agreia sp. COWG]|nr:protein of unknown function [Agreia sp. COWG]